MTDRERADRYRRALLAIRAEFEHDPETVLMLLPKLLREALDDDQDTPLLPLEMD
jgi:hypothetical protein